MFIWPEFRMGKYKDDGHNDDAPHFTNQKSYQIFQVKKSLKHQYGNLPVSSIFSFLFRMT